MNPNDDRYWAGCDWITDNETAHVFDFLEAEKLVEVFDGWCEETGKDRQSTRVMVEWVYKNYEDKFTEYMWKRWDDHNEPDNVGGD